MVNPRLEGQRFKLGVWTVSDLTTTYELRNTSTFAIQSDQDEFMTPWLVRGKESAPLQRARSVQTADGTTLEDGFYQFQWTMSYMTFGMASYWNATKLGGAASADVTVMTYNQNNTAVYLVCKTSKLVFPRDGGYWPGGWRDVTIKFDYGTVIT